jgi:hypothetical protein
MGGFQPVGTGVVTSPERFRIPPVGDWLWGPLDSQTFLELRLKLRI